MQYEVNSSKTPLSFLAITLETACRALLQKPLYGLKLKNVAI